MNIKQYKLENFDYYNIELIKKLVKIFLKEIKNLKIKTFNETTGFYKNIDLRTLIKELNKFSKEYTGLDEIILENKDFSPLGIVVHHELCMVQTDEILKKKLENELKINLVLYKKE